MKYKKITDELIDLLWLSVPPIAISFCDKIVKEICSRDKVALWFTFFSEVKFKPAYHQICKERDLYYQKITEDIFRELINLEKSKISLINISNGLQALVMGLWLDQLEDPDTFNRKQAKQICFDYIKSNFPKQFKNIL